MVSARVAPTGVLAGAAIASTRERTGDRTRAPADVRGILLSRSSPSEVEVGEEPTAIPHTADNPIS